MRTRSRHILLAVAIVFVVGCATNVKKPTAHNNPPPLEAFSRFNRFELKPINTSEGCDKQHGADVALNAIQDRTNARLGAVLTGWNSARRTGTKDRKLVIEPVCSDAKLIGTHARIWGGALAGSSAIVLKVRFVDAETRKMIAEPVFYQRANAMGGAFSFGGTDRDMLNRIVDLVTSYTSNNYASVVGGPTGL